MAAREPVVVPDRDATLDAFVEDATTTSEADADDEEPTESPGDAAGERVDEATDDTSTGEVEAADPADESAPGSADEEPPDPMVSTYAWTPDPVECPSCGASTTARWRTDAGFVCPDCVDWERTPNDA